MSWIQIQAWGEEKSMQGGHDSKDREPETTNHVRTSEARAQGYGQVGKGTRRSVRTFRLEVSWGVYMQFDWADITNTE